ncbi:MAG: hypothetical protein K1X79_05610 [Oligoflexia bacterium]|nr:hypothetical protein [Oligoflexia bacterium]
MLAERSNLHDLVTHSQEQFMLVVIGTTDRYLGLNLTRLCNDAKLRSIRTAKVDRIIKELKIPERVVIIDMAWEEIQVPGVLKQLVNIGRITDNKILCVCPNTEEDLKKMARAARATEVFIRYDLETRFLDYLKML